MTVVAAAIADTLPRALRAYCDLRRGLGQVVQLLAVAAGVKPVLDDWIDVEDLGRFERVMEELGLHMAVDEVFDFASGDDELSDVIGGELLNTTRARVMAGSDVGGGLAHVYLGRSELDVSEASLSGWYNLIVHDRVVPKPWIDHHWFGRLLGYPDCCLQSFATTGAWNVANPYAAATGPTTAAAGTANPVHRHSGLAYVVHYPCRFDCPSTVALGRAVRAVVRETSPALAEAVDERVSGPHLLLSGYVSYGFPGGVVRGETITYSAVVAAPTNRPDEALAGLLCQGDSVEVRGDVLLVRRGAHVVGTRAVQADRYAPEHVSLLDFRRPS